MAVAVIATSKKDSIQFGPSHYINVAIYIINFFIIQSESLNAKSIL